MICVKKLRILCCCVLYDDYYIIIRGNFFILLFKLLNILFFYYYIILIFFIIILFISRSRYPCRTRLCWTIFFFFFSLEFSLSRTLPLSPVAPLPTHMVDAHTHDVHTDMHAYTHTHTHTHTHAYMHTYAHICTHMHTLHFFNLPQKFGNLSCHSICRANVQSTQKPLPQRSKPLQRAKPSFMSH